MARSLKTDILIILDDHDRTNGQVFAKQTPVLPSQRLAEPKVSSALF